MPHRILQKQSRRKMPRLSIPSSPHHFAESMHSDCVSSCKCHAGAWCHQLDWRVPAGLIAYKIRPVFCKKIDPHLRLASSDCGTLRENGKRMRKVPYLGYPAHLWAAFGSCLIWESISMNRRAFLWAHPWGLAFIDAA